MGCTLKIGDFVTLSDIMRIHYEFSVPIKPMKQPLVDLGKNYMSSVIDVWVYPSNNKECHDTEIIEILCNSNIYRVNSSWLKKVEDGN